MIITDQQISQLASAPGNLLELELLFASPVSSRLPPALSSGSDSCCLEGAWVGRGSRCPPHTSSFRHLGVRRPSRPPSAYTRSTPLESRWPSKRFTCWGTLAAAFGDVGLRSVTLPAPRSHQAFLGTHWTKLSRFTVTLLEPEQFRNGGLACAHTCSGTQ